MKRPSDDDEGENSRTSDSEVEAFLCGFLQRHPKFFVYLTIALILLVVLALGIARFAT